MADEITPPSTPAEETPPTDQPAGGTPPTDQPAESWFQTLPETWREDLAGEDEGRLNQLKRVPDLPTFAKNYFEAQDSLRTRQESAGLPENPTDEQLAEYRTKIGVPETADKYELGEGLVLSDEDRKELAPVFEIMHANNIPHSAAADLVDTYTKLENQRTERMASQDVLDSQAAIKQLKEQWGPDYETNRSITVANLAAHLPEEAMESFMGARLANGKALFNDPGVVEAFAQMARVINPAATLVPSGSNPVQSLEARQAELTDKMGTPEWYKDKAAQKEFLDNETALEQLRSRQK